jgi:hypothetical protein
MEMDKGEATSTPSPFENLCENNNDSSLGRILHWPRSRLPDPYFLFYTGWICLPMFTHLPAYLASPPLPRAKLPPIWYLCDGIRSN